VASNDNSNLPGIVPEYRGKVRDIYDLGDMLIIVASDRVSAFDSVIPTLIPVSYTHLRAHET